MIGKAIATVFVSDLDRAVQFYTEVLGLRLVYRAGGHWASIDAGGGSSIGLHPATEHNPAGKSGSITLGLYLARPLPEVVAALRQKGVKFRGDPINDTTVRIAHFSDPDGNELYIADMPSS